MALKLKGSTSGFVGLDAPSVAGNNTLILPENSGSAFQVFANDITAGVTTFTQVTVSRNGDLTVPGTISIGGTLTYEDVTNVDSVGVITARQGIFIDDSITHLGDTNTKIRFPGSDTFTVETGGSEIVRVNNIGMGVGITPVKALNVVVGSGTTELIRLSQTVDASVQQEFGIGWCSNNDHDHPGAKITSQEFDVSDSRRSLVFYTRGTNQDIAPTERLRIDSNGRLLIGTDVSRQTRLGTSTFHSIVQVESDGEAAVNVSRFNDGSGSSRLVLQKSRGTAASPAVVQDDDTVGQILFSGWDGDTFTNTAQIRSEVDGTPGDDDMPGNLIFGTTADGATGATERLRIASDGHVAIGGYGDPGSILDVREEQDGAETRIRLFNTDNDNTTTQTAALYLSPDSRATALTGLRSIKENADMSASTARDVSLTLNTLQNNSQVEAIRIDSNGRVLIGATSSVNVASSGAGILQVEVDSTGIPATFYSTVDASGPSGVIGLGHGRGTVAGVLQNNDVVGEIRFAGGDGTDCHTQAALIQAKINGSPGSNNMPTDLIFYTNGGSSSVGERLRILKGGGITFNGDTASTNALDDYEEGNYVPTVTGSTSGTGTLNTSYNNLSYTKIGNLCTVNGRVRLSSENMSGTYVVVSLPFTIANLSEEAGRTTGTVVIQNASQPPNGYVLHPVENNSYVQIARGNSGSSMTNATNTFSGDEIICISITFRTT